MLAWLPASAGFGGSRAADEALKPCSPADGQSPLGGMAVVSKENGEETSRKLPCPSAVWKNGPEKGPGETSRRRK